MLCAHVWLRLLLIFYQAQAVISCIGPGDCNDHNCADCSCVNGQCNCVGGWSGPSCTTPFCNNSSECSNHGSCQQTLHNVSCDCDTGFSGPRCSISNSSCSLVCRHGGTPNEDCTSCENCLGAWGGRLCDQYDHSVPVDKLLAAMQANYVAGQQSLNATLPQHPLCIDGQECVGWGVDIFDGRVAEATVLELSVDPADESKKWHGFLAPQQVTFRPFANPQSTFSGGGVFPLPADFQAYVESIVGPGDGLRGIYSSSWMEIFQSYFNSSADNALSVVQAQIGLFEMEITPEADNKLEKHFVNIVQGLPANYATANERALWNRFFALVSAFFFFYFFFLFSFFLFFFFFFPVLLQYCTPCNITWVACNQEINPNPL